MNRLDPLSSDAIRKVCSEVGIESLLHFTRIENLSEIVRVGLKSRQSLRREGRKYVANDPLRLDWRNRAVSLSIGFPNYQVFFSFRRKTPTAAWVVIELEVRVLWEQPCEFLPMNAAAKQAQPGWLRPNERRDPNTLRKLFGTLVANSKKTTSLREIDRATLAQWGIPKGWPTNPQAEVLALSDIAPDAIRTLHFASSKVLAHWRAQQADGQPTDATVSADLFGPRSDYKLWQELWRERLP